MSEKKKIAVIFGGQSSEYEISRESAASVASRLDPEKYELLLIGVTRDGRWLVFKGTPADILTEAWEQAAARGDGDNGIEALFRGGRDGSIHAAMPILHGRNGEDGTVQGLLALAGVPFTGSGVLGSAAGMDKVISNRLFEQVGIPHCRYLAFSEEKITDRPDGVMDRITATLGFPCFVKPVCAGSSVGVSRAADRGALAAALKEALSHDRRVMVEEAVRGREVECAVLGNDAPEASGVGEIIPCNEFYDYEAKYRSDGASKTIIPADLPDKVAARIREYAVRAFLALRCAGMARVDFFIRCDCDQSEPRVDDVLISELNTIPGFTSISMYPKLWAAAGVDYPALLDRLIALAREKAESKRRVR